MNPWHIRDPIEFARERACVEQAHAHLNFVLADDHEKIVGTFELREDETVLDRFSIEIKLAADYPNSVPVVYEVGGRIPRTMDRHCYPASGSACLFLPDERWTVWPQGSSLLSFIDSPVKNYFLSQAIFEREGIWRLGERGHGIRGKEEYFQELLGTADLSIAAKYFEILSRDAIKGHWDCPCGSGQRLRKCHFDLIRNLREKIPRGEAKRTVDRLESDLAYLARSVS